MIMKHTQGFIALTSVLILSAIFLSISISIASRAISGGDASIALYERDKAKFFAEACAEYALMELQRTLNYDGDEGILVGDGSCTVRTVVGTENENRSVEVESTVGAHTYRIRVGVDEISPVMEVGKQERVESF
jgi:hypothetical protein